MFGFIGTAMAEEPETVIAEVQEVQDAQQEKKTIIELPQWVKNIKFSGYGILQYQGMDPYKKEKDENGNPILAKRKITKKFNPPDINALRFILEQSKLSDDAISKMTDKELEKEKQRLLQLLKEKESKKNENGEM